MATDLLEKLLAGAAAHAEASDPDHEVGDLQDILRSCWKRLTAEQQREVYDENEDVIVCWLREG
jgi:hypothetical protein